MVVAVFVLDVADAMGRIVAGAESNETELVGVATVMVILVAVLGVFVTNVVAGMFLLVDATGFFGSDTLFVLAVFFTATGVFVDMTGVFDGVFVDAASVFDPVTGSFVDRAGLAPEKPILRRRDEKNDSLFVAMENAFVANGVAWLMLAS